MRFAEGPVFIESLPSQVTGVDFLGLAAVNERYVALALPGISNVTRYMRAYSAMSWLCWRFDHYVKQNAGTRPITEEHIAATFRKYREKVELLFTLGNPGFNQVAGQSRSAFVPEGNKQFALEFAGFGDYKISWLDAAVYGPSLGTDSGLGFIERAPGRSYRPTALGEEMATAIDESLQRSEYYEELFDIRGIHGTREMVEGLAPHWTMRKATAKEKACFRKAFVREDAGEEGTSLRANRATMVRLILRALEASGGAGTVADVRETIARGTARTGRALDVTGCAKTQGLWSVLQLRQLQRLAHEALLRWLEIALVHLPSGLRGRTPDDLVELAAEQASVHLQMGRTEALGVLVDRICRSTNAESFFVQGLSDPYVDPFQMLYKLQELKDLKVGFSLLPASAVAALTLCAGEVQKMNAREHTLPWLNTGGRGRLSLRTLSDIFASYRAESLGVFVRFLIESCVIGQHFAVTNAKLEPNKNKYRFISGADEGLRPLIRPNQITDLGVTGDRLQNAMELMADCALLNWDKAEGMFSAP